MLKSIKIIPPKDLFSFIDNKYFPYSLLPNIKFIYKNKTISYDKKDIILIYSLNNSIKSLKRKLYENNELIIDFKYIINPNKIILENNYDILINKRINKIKNILPFCNNITNLIISFLPKPNLSWKIKKENGDGLQKMLYLIHIHFLIILSHFIFQRLKFITIKHIF